MPSRETHDTSRRPQRARSNSSIICRAPVFREAGLADSQNINHDALTAAHLAYERASQHREGWKADAFSRGEQDSGKGTQTQPLLGRRQSIRFVGPNAVPTRTRSIIRREAPIHHSKHASQQQHLPTEHKSDLDSRSITALPEVFNESYIASEPSSYRKLRRAKSMFSSRRAPSNVPTAHNSNRRRHFERHSTQFCSSTNEFVRDRDRDPQLRRSCSFLRGVVDHISIDKRQYSTHDAAIQLARDAFLRELEQQRLKERPSIFNIHRRQKTQKAFRRTVRTSSTNSYGTAVSSPLPVATITKPKGLGSKTRTVSQSWMKKFRQIFTRSSNEAGTIPVQHLDSSQPHYDRRISNPQHPSSSFPPIPGLETELLRQSGSRESSVHSEPTYLRKSSSQGSIRSASSEDEKVRDESRVTSWTDSTTTNTIKLPSYVERKRLTMIKEDGDPHKSSLSPAQSCGAAHNGYANFRQPLLPSGVGNVETKRIFSALQKQIDENNRKTLCQGESLACIRDLSDHDTEHQSVSHSLAKPCMQPEVHPSDIRNDDHTEHHVGGPFDATELQASTRLDNDPRGAVNRATQDDHSQNRIHLSGNLTPQQIAELKEPSAQMSKGPLREVTSSFFPPSMRIARNYASPYKRAMHAKGQGEKAGTMIKTMDQQMLVDNSQRVGSLARTESIYTRSPSSQYPDQTGSSTSLFQPAPRSQTSDTPPIKTRTSLHQPPLAPLLLQNVIDRRLVEGSESDSSSKMASIDSVKEQDRAVIDAYPAKTHGHKRENAQLNHEDARIGFMRTPDSTLAQSLARPYGETTEHLNLERMLSTKDALAGLASADVRNENRSSPSPPARPRNRNDKENEKSELVGLRKTPSNLRRESPRASLTPQSVSSRDASGRCLRSSPERAERLRRLKTSRSTTPQGTSPYNDNQTPPSWWTDRQQQCDSADSKGSMTLVPIQAGINTRLVNTFLRDRRRDMRISEESGNDPAFL